VRSSIVPSRVGVAFQNYFLKPELQPLRTPLPRTTYLTWLPHNNLRWKVPEERLSAREYELYVFVIGMSYPHAKPYGRTAIDDQ
jgi:hypothetical protein